MERTTGPISQGAVVRGDSIAKGLGMPGGLHPRLKHNCETWLTLCPEEDSSSPNGSDRDGWMMDGCSMPITAFNSQNSCLR